MDKGKVRELCALVTIDIENAFNCVPWSDTTKAMEEIGIPMHLINVIGSYLSHRWIAHNAKKYCMYCGVPQGSVLGPLLWKIFFNSILEFKVSPHT